MIQSHTFTFIFKRTQHQVIKEKIHIYNRVTPVAHSEVQLYPTHYHIICNFWRHAEVLQEKW